MANGHGLFEEVQSMFEDESVPQSVSNRLIMAAIISERKDRISRDCEVTEFMKINREEINKLKLSDRRWGILSTIAGVITAALVSMGLKQ